MIQNFKLTIEYDGTRYHGWQKQKNHQTIQEQIEKALKIMTKQNIDLHGSGRTDAGVHALAQTANFQCQTKITPKAFQAGLKALTPEDIVIKECVCVDKEFHARFSVKDKTYCYKIVNQDIAIALGRQYVWYIRKKLNVKAMKHATQYIVGEHDFKAFEGAGSPRSNTVRKILKAHFTHEPGNYIIFEIKGTGFLRYMVRNIVGTLVDVGLNRKKPDDIKKIIDSKDRKMAGPTAPANGLFLKSVNYG